MLNYPCAEVNRAVPYFKEFNRDKYPNYNVMDDYLYDKLVALHDANISFTDKNFYVPEIDALPDGAIMIKEANTRQLKYNI